MISIFCLETSAMNQFALQKMFRFRNLEMVWAPTIQRLPIDQAIVIFFIPDIVTNISVSF